MTRDEAIEKIKSVTRSPGVATFEGHLLDSLVALSVLKLEESRSVEEEIADALSSDKLFVSIDTLPAGCGYRHTGYIARHSVEPIIKQLRNRGFKIVKA